MHDLSLFHEDDDIRIETSLGDTETLIFSFNSYSADCEDGVRSGHPFLRDRGMSAIYITARRNNWWQIPGVEAVFARLAPLSRDYPRRVTYGSSMGGYGALLFARDLGANAAVALVPQTVIGNPRYRLKPAWAAEIARRSITRDDVVDTIGAIPDVKILYDPWHSMDRAFVDYLAGRVTLTHYPFPFIGHMIAPFLAQAGLIGDIIAAILTDRIDPVGVRNLVRPARRRSAHYIKGMMMRCEKRRGHRRPIG